MADSTAGPITFLVPGTDARAATRGATPEPAPDRPDGLREIHSIAIATNRDGAVATAIATPGEHIVVLQIAGGPELRLRPETARDLMMAQRSTSATGRGSQ